MQEQFLPQMNPKPEMGAAAAAEYDTSPSLLRNPPPIPAGTAHPSTPDMDQLFAMLAEMRNGINNKMNGINNKMDGMDNKMKENLKENAKQIKEEMKEMRGEMRQMGQCLQAGIMAPPRAGTNELGGA